MTDTFPKVLSFIPARGGSKGLPRKNILLLGKMPLIAYSIKAAVLSKHVNRIIVSTDDEEIADIAMQNGAEVPFLRPAKLGKDSSTIGSVKEYTLNRLRAEEGYIPDVVVTLYPTHPFRPIALVDFLIQKALSGYNPVITVKKMKHDRSSLFSTRDNGKIAPLLPPGLFGEKTFFREYGLLSAHTNADIRPYVYTIHDPISLIDIDTPQDFLIAQGVVQNNLFKFHAASE